MSFPGGTAPTFQYNGFSFPSSTRSHIRGRPLYDGADRTVATMVYTIQSVSIIAADTAEDTTDDQMNDLMNRLSKPGQRLVYADSGGGSFRVNVGNVRDVMWGPKPRDVSIRPLGSQKAWELIWACEVAIPKCDNASYAGMIMAFNYDVDYKVDSDGYTTRLISGYLEIPMTRVGGGRTVPDTADAYYEEIVPSIPAGFRRTEKLRHLSADKRRLEFSFVDEQIPGGTFPVSITNFDGTLRTATTPMNWTKFDCSLSASYTVPAGVPRTAASDAFFNLLLDKARPSKDKGRIFVSFDASEGLGLNRKINFNASWFYVGTVADCLQDSGFWRPLPGVTWQQWQQSAGVNDKRGSAGLVHSASDDAIVDLCIGGVGILRSGHPRVTNRLVLRQRPVGAQPAILKTDKTWLLYRIKLIIEAKPSTSRLKSLPKDEPKTNGMGETPIPTLSSSRTASDRGFDYTLQAIAGAKDVTSGKLINEALQTPDVIQQRAAPSYRAILTGFAMRGGLGIPLPKLVTVGGIKPVPSKQWSTGDTLIANFSGVAIYYKGFRLEYDLPEAPDNAKVEVPPNAELMLAR